MGLRKRAIEALGPQRGDTVVEIGCGTGLNFGLLDERIGPEGRLIGVDLTDAMLAGARTRIEASGWRNIELVESPAASFRFPPEVDGILSTFALTLEPDFDRVVEEGAKALKPGRRWVNSRPQAAIQLATPSSAGADPLGQTVRSLCRGGEAPPWESLQRHLKHVTMQELYFGVAYVAVGEALSGAAGGPMAPRSGRRATS